MPGRLMPTPKRCPHVLSNAAPPPLLRISSRRPKNACAAVHRAKRGLANSTVRRQPPAGRAGSQLDKPSTVLLSWLANRTRQHVNQSAFLICGARRLPREHAASGKTRAVNCKPQAQAAGLRPNAVGPARPWTPAAMMLSAAHALGGPKPSACGVSMDLGFQFWNSKLKPTKA